MPIYVYRNPDGTAGCEHCRVSFEEFQSLRDPVLQQCPRCRGPVVRLITPVVSQEMRTTSQILSDDNLRKHGFKKLVNRGRGQGFDEVV